MRGEKKREREGGVGGYLGFGNNGWCTYRTRRALRPLKAPSLMWLMELRPSRSVCRSPSMARLPSSRRVKLLYDRFLDRRRRRQKKMGQTQTYRGKKKTFAVRSGRRWQVYRTQRQLATSLDLNFMADLKALCKPMMSFFPWCNKLLAEWIQQTWKQSWDPNH